LKEESLATIVSRAGSCAGADSADESIRCWSTLRPVTKDLLEYVIV
jgi:hypothetical protein